MTKRVKSLLHNNKLIKLFLFVIIVTLFTSQSFSRWRFEEGDWIAWGDGRVIYDIEIGRNVVYFATDAGILRYDRYAKNWLYPWYTVPGQLHEAETLEYSRRIIEDPVTLDLYVKTNKTWLQCSSVNNRWEKISQPPENLVANSSNSKKDNLTPRIASLMPFDYFLGDEFSLEYRYLSWPLGLGETDNFDCSYFNWIGYGIGIAGLYSYTIELYPVGPGPSAGLFVNDDEIWAVNKLQRGEGWLWHLDRSETRWDFKDPGIEWGLEDGRVSRLRVSADGTVWIATDNGLMFSKGNSWRHLRKKDGLPKERINDLAVIGNEAWISTGYGLAQITPDGDVLRPDSKSNPVLYYEKFDKLASDADTLYAAGAGELWRLSPFRDWESVEMPSMTAMATSPTALYANNGMLAIGDKDGVSWRFPGKNWETLFANRWNWGVVRSIIYHGDILWFGTDKGLVKFDPETGKLVVLNSKDGLAGNSVYEIIAEDDWLWLGTDKALVRYYWNAEGRID